MSERGKVFAVSGKAQSGKGVFAAVGKTMGMEELSFAMALKQECAAFLNKLEIPYRTINLWGSNAEKDELLFYTHSLERADILYPGASHFFIDRSKITVSFFQFSSRALLQWWGTEYRRKQAPDYWVQKVLAQIAAKPTTSFVISDLRFKNEAIACRAAGHILVRVDRPDTRIAHSEHSSERDLDDWDDWDLHLENTSSLVAYQQTVAMHLARFSAT